MEPNYKQGDEPYTMSKGHMRDSEGSDWNDRRADAVEQLRLANVSETFGFKMDHLEEAKLLLQCAIDMLWAERKHTLAIIELEQQEAKRQDLIAMDDQETQRRVAGIAREEVQGPIKHGRDCICTGCVQDRSYGDSR